MNKLEKIKDEMRSEEKPDFLEENRKNKNSEVLKK